MVEWLAGNRIRGTSAEKPVFGLSSGSVGGWVELGRSTVPSGGATTVTVTGLTDKRYYMGLFYSKHSGTWTQPRLRIGDGSIATSGYGIRYHMYYSNTEQSGAQTDTGYPLWTSPSAPNKPVFGTFIIANKSDKNKLGICHSVGQQSAGATNAPERNEGVFTYNYTSGSIDQIQLFDAGGSNFAEGTQLVILGWDPADTHTTNFWEQLATASGAGSTLDTGTFTAKKYLWVQGYCKPTSSSNIRLNFNSDVSGNYAIRESINGGSDTVNTQQASTDNVTGTSTGGLYFNMFIINIADQEKLWISDGQENTAGVGTAGDRKEMTGKWITTSEAITKIVATSNFGATSELKVWGHD